ncbi:hypothetical protein M885DRAFT_51359 [Pelagophyceae sp. CCMP2097]|nr:hypothetical protein M885DRAFT_51359 [Pelagophyceae sp. CCMP2097]
MVASQKSLFVDSRVQEHEHAQRRDRRQLQNPCFELIDDDAPKLLHRDVAVLPDDSVGLARQTGSSVGPRHFDGRLLERLDCCLHINRLHVGDRLVALRLKRELLQGPHRAFHLPVGRLLCVGEWLRHIRPAAVLCARRLFFVATARHFSIVLVAVHVRDDCGNDHRARVERAFPLRPLRFLRAV